MSENLKDNIQWMRDTIDLTEKQQKLVDFLDAWADFSDPNYYKLLNLVALLEPVLQDAGQLLRHQACCEQNKFVKLNQHLNLLLDKVQALSDSRIRDAPIKGF